MPDGRIPVWLEPSHRRRYRPIPMESAGRAFAHALVSVGPHEWFTRFLIDTGADFTLLSASAAEDLLGDDYRAIDYERDPLAVMVGGISGLLRCVAREADLTFRTEDGEDLEVRAPILIAEGLHRLGGSHRPEMHSLLGRDLLGRGELRLAWRLPRELHFTNLPSAPSALP